MIPITRTPQQSILFLLNSLWTLNRSQFSLGKFDGKIRPLKISLASASDVFKTLGSSRKLKSDQIFNAVRITSDKTPKQRLYFQNLRKELDKRRSDGESNLTIKYVKGIPSIVNSAVQKN